jgi:two-component system NtrC family sensor kinase
LIAILGIIFTLFGYLITELHRRDLESVNSEAADRISDSIKRSILYSMQLNHREHIYHTIKTIGGEPGINKVRIFNEIGRISFSSDDTEINRLVDKREEACYVCHNQEEPLRRLERPDRHRIFYDAQGNRILGVINAIENEPSCWEADCHAHAPEQTILGVLDVTVSLAHVDEIIHRGRNLMLIQLGISVLGVSILLGLLVWNFVDRPIRQLMVGTEKIASGDLDYRIQVNTSDEMGALGASFNRMTRQLEQARSEVTAWTQTLEERVEAKTAELKKAHEQMIQVERMASMGKLAAIVAHEINNPLTGILTSTRLILKRIDKNSIELKDDSAEHLEMIADEASRCGGIVKNLLQFARPNGKTREPEDINYVIRESVRLVQHKINLMSVETQFELSDHLPPVVCDAQGIKQALLAILINACEALGGSGGEIAIGSELLAGDTRVCIWIRDNGHGMDEQTQKRIFEPFFTTKDEVRGVGLGMAVVSGIVGAHGGTVEVESEVSHGTTIRICLPTQASNQIDRVAADVQEERSLTGA